MLGPRENPSNHPSLNSDQTPGSTHQIMDEPSAFSSKRTGQAVELMLGKGKLLSIKNQYREPHKAFCFKDDPGINAPEKWL